MEGFALPPGLGNVQLLQVNTAAPAGNSLQQPPQTVPQAIANLPAGTVVKGYVVSRDQQNNPVLRTPRGDVAVKSDVFLKTGSMIELRISVHQARIMAKIITIDDIPLKEFAGQQQARAATSDTVMQPSMLRPSAPQAQPAPLPGTQNPATLPQQPLPPAPQIETTLLQPAEYGDARQTRQTIASILQTSPANLPPMEKDTVLQFRIIQAATLPSSAPAAGTTPPPSAFGGPSYSAATLRPTSVPAAPQPPLSAQPVTGSTSPPLPASAPSPASLPAATFPATAPSAAPVTTPPVSTAMPPLPPATAATLPATPPAAAPSAAPVSYGVSSPYPDGMPQSPTATGLTPIPVPATPPARPHLSMIPSYPAQIPPPVSVATPAVTSPATANQLAAQSHLNRTPLPAGSAGPLTVATTPPTTMAGAMATQEPLSRPGSLTATIIGHEPGGTSIARTAIGTLRLQTATPPPVGSRLQLEWVPQQIFTGTSWTPDKGISFAPPSPPVSTDPLQVAGRLSHNWQALSESLHLLQQESPQFARELTQRIPNTRSGMVNSVLFFVSAMKGGDIRRWLGNPATNAIEDSKPSLLARLGADFISMARVNNDLPDQNWNMLLLPMMHEDELNQLRLYVRDDAQNGKDGKDQGTRFVMDISLSELGEMQLDGWVHSLSGSKQFDLVVRSESALEPVMQEELNTLFTNALQTIGYQGSLSFQHGFRQFVKPLQEMVHPKGGDNGSILA